LNISNDFLTNLTCKNIFLLPALLPPPPPLLLLLLLLLLLIIIIIIIIRFFIKVLAEINTIWHGMDSNSVQMQ
jgi:hypothetical protein